MKAIEALKLVERNPDYANYFGVNKYNVEDTFHKWFGECELTGKFPNQDQMFIWFWFGSDDEAPVNFPDFVLKPENGKIFGYIID